MRIFIAAFPSPEAQQAAFGVIGRLRRAGDGVWWVRRESLHYTLRFMGELEEDALTRVIAAAGEAAGGSAPFTARLGGLGAYPDARRARVLWLGLSEGAQALVAVAQTMERALVARGFEAAERPFSPHLTLGRPRRSGEDWSARLAAGAVEPDPEPSFTIDRVQVVHSTLSPGGSIYRVRAEAALGAALTG